MSVRPDAFVNFNRSMQKLLSDVKRIHAGLAEVINTVYETTRVADWEHSPLADLIELREKCNDLVWGSTSYEVTTSRIGDLLEATMSALRKLRVWIKSSVPPTEFTIE